MEVEYYKQYSTFLNRDMEFKVYGHSGKVFVVFPAQDGRFFDFENFKMVEASSWYVENGLVQFFCVDSVDKESWSLMWQDESKRIEVQENYFHYICDEFYPYMKEIHDTTSNSDEKFECFTTGCSMGATHALNFFLRRPDLFNGTLAMSGVYHASYFFPDYHDPRIYDNSIVDYLSNMAIDHHYLDLYRNSKIVICAGQGKWEEETIKDTDFVKEQLNRLNVPAWIDFWGGDVDHDWPWWRKQIAYFLQFFVR